MGFGYEKGKFITVSLGGHKQRRSWRAKSQSVKQIGWQGRGAVSLHLHQGLPPHHPLALVSAFRLVEDL